MSYVIDDSNYKKVVVPPVINGERKSKGYFGMWQPSGLAAAKSFADLGVPLIDKAEWQDRVREQEQLKSNLREFSLEMGLPCLDQNGTNYCWINGPVHCMEIERLKETGQVVSYSPASAGARIKNFRNVGGWGSEGLEWLRQHGVNTTDEWPANAINRRYDTRENRESAKANIVVEYFKLSSWEEVVSCILALIPVAVGYNWWRHEVTGTHLVLPERRRVDDVDLGIRNSWSMQWGDQGFATLSDSKKYPDDAVAIVSMVAA